MNSLLALNIADGIDLFFKILPRKGKNMSLKMKDRSFMWLIVSSKLNIFESNNFNNSESTV